MEWSKLDSEQRLTTGQVSQWLNISASKLNKLRMTEDGPKYEKIGQNVRYPVGNVRVWLSEHQRIKTRFCTTFDLDFGF